MLYLAHRLFFKLTKILQRCLADSRNLHDVIKAYLRLAGELPRLQTSPRIRKEPAC
jgi:hypothetical protein